MASPTFRQVESWRWVIAQWLSLASFQLSCWWLDKGDVLLGCWLSGAGVHVPFSETNELWLRSALEGYPDVDDYRRQLCCRRFMHRNKVT